MQPGGPTALRASHGHSRSMFLHPQPPTNQLRASMPEDVQNQIFHDMNRIL